MINWLRKKIFLKNKKLKDKVIFLINIIKKPLSSKAPSDYSASGKYIFTNNFFNFLKGFQPDKNKEIQVTKGISKLITSGNKILEYNISENVYDCEDKLGYFKAIEDSGLAGISILKHSKNHY